METSIFLAKVLGIFGTISVLAILIKYRDHLRMEAEMVDNLKSVYTSGFVIVGIGSFLVAYHNIWTKDWRVIITILAWSTLLKGALRLFFPETVRKLVHHKSKSQKYFLAELAVFLISLFLLYHGFGK